MVIDSVNYLPRPTQLQTPPLPPALRSPAAVAGGEPRSPRGTPHAPRGQPRRRPAKFLATALGITLSGCINLPPMSFRFPRLPPERSYRPLPPLPAAAAAVALTARPLPSRRRPPAAGAGRRCSLPPYPGLGRRAEASALPRPARGE